MYSGGLQSCWCLDEPTTKLLQYIYIANKQRDDKAENMNFQRLAKLILGSK